MPAEFADKIPIAAVNLSTKTKAFLKEKAITNVLQLSKIDLKTLLTTSCKHMRREIGDFVEFVKKWMNKKIKNIHFTRNFPPPKKRPRHDEKAVLIAVILGEPLLGNRRNIATAKQILLPRLYENESYKKRNCTFARTMRNYRCAA